MGCPGLKSLKNQVLPSTVTTTPSSGWYWSQSGWVQVASDRVVDPRTQSSSVFNSLLPHTAFSKDSIKRSSDLMEPVYQVCAMVVSQSADGDFVVPLQQQDIQLLP